MLTPDRLRPFQTRAANFLAQTPYCALWMGMGLGKTVSVLTQLQALHAAGEVERILVAAPKLVAEDVWPHELETWEHLGGLSCAVITGSERNRQKQLARDVPIHAINHENLVWLWKQFGKRKWPYDTLVIDECSRGYKNPRRRTVPKKGSKNKRNLTRFGAAVNIRHLPITRRVIELTGTPAPSGYLDLWSQIYLLDLGERLGKTYEMYKRRYFIENPYSYEIKIAPGAKEEIDDKIRDIAISMLERDYLQLPDRIYQTEIVRLPEEVKKQYNYFRRHFILEHRDDVEAANTGVLKNKLLQLANGSVYNEHGEDIWLHDEKVKALKKLVEEYRQEGEQVLVAYSFEFDKARIQRALPETAVLGEGEDAAVLRRWRAGELGVLLCHPASIGYGLSLQAGGSTQIWYGLTWDLELYLQFNKRLHRGDQSRPVVIHHIVAEDTEDERVLPRLTERDSTQSNLLSSVAQ